ncbi:hypothetical protein IWW50_004121, partial [Coemansia erecta]
HDVFAMEQHATTTTTGIGPRDAARVWRGCLRYQAMFGARLRVVLAEWPGMSPRTARQWRSYLGIYAAHATQAPLVHLASVTANPPAGLQLASPSAPADVLRVPSAPLQWSLVLQGRQPHIASASSRCTHMPDEPIDPHRWPTGYLVLQDCRPCTPSIACLCVQLLDDDENDAAAKPSHASRCHSDLLTARAVLRQYHQLARLRHAELDAAESMPHAHADSWPLHLLPLPVAVVADICYALDLLS